MQKKIIKNFKKLLLFKIFKIQKTFSKFRIIKETKSIKQNITQILAIITKNFN